MLDHQNIRTGQVQNLVVNLDRICRVVSVNNIIKLWSANIVNTKVLLSHFTQAIRRIFTGGQMDMSKLSNVKFDRRDAKQLANNYRNMIQPCNEQCGERPETK